MANDSDVARVVAALRAPSIKYFSFGNAPVRRVAPPAEEPAGLPVSLAAEPVAPAAPTAPATPAADPGEYRLLRIIEDDYVPPALAMPALAPAPAPQAAAPAEPEWALLATLAGEAPAQPGPIRVPHPTIALARPDQAALPSPAPRLLSVLRQPAAEGAAAPAHASR
jgi:hypothetical protein